MARPIGEQLDRCAWLLACQGTYFMASNEDYASGKGAVVMKLRLHNGTAEGHTLKVQGRTTNDCARQMKEEVLKYVAAGS